MSIVATPSAPHTFDALFCEMGEIAQLPPALLKAIAVMESSLNPAAQAPDSSAIGLGQITTVALREFNRQMHVDYALEELTDPKLNLQIVDFVLTCVVKALTKSTSLKPDWADPRWIGLVCLGYTAGYSARQGVAGLVHALESRGEPVTLETVVREARRHFPRSRFWVAPELADAHGLGPFMSDSWLLDRVRREVSLYFQFRDEGMVLPAPPKVAPIVPVTVVDKPSDTRLGAISAVATILMLALAWIDHRAQRRSA